jgi:ATP-binding protein involved in chromosome partitioning
VSVHCGEGTEIFGRGGARAEAELLTGVPFLGEIPLHPELREASDAGRLVALWRGARWQRRFTGLHRACCMRLKARTGPHPKSSLKTSLTQM